MNVGRFFVIAAFVGVLCLLAGPAMAAPPHGGHPGGHPGGEGKGDITGLVDHLEESGFDLSTVREALTTGDNSTARSLLDQFFEENKDALPVPPERESSNQTALSPGTLGEAPNRTDQDRNCGMTGLLDQFEELGYDVSAIREAIDSGDSETARSLMKEFMEEHKDELPNPPAGGKDGGMTGLLDHFEELGYDVSAIREAIDSGDSETARSLMKEFMEEHKDELPEPPSGGKDGGMTALLDHFEELGYDMTAIREAIDSGDSGTARTLMKEFMEEHKDELPEPPAASRPGDGSGKTG